MKHIQYSKPCLVLALVVTVLLSGWTAEDEYCLHHFREPVAQTAHKLPTRGNR